MLETDAPIRILLDVTLGIPAPAGESEERAKVRRAYQADADAIIAQGGIVEIPSEIAEIDRGPDS